MRPRESYENHDTLRFQTQRNSAALTGDGKFLATGTTHETPSLWDLESGERVQSFEGHTKRVWSIALSGDSKRVLTSSLDGKAILWDATSGRKLRTFTGGIVALSTDGKLAVTGGTRAILWNAESGDKLRVLEGHTDDIRAMALSKDGKHLVVTWT